MKTIKFTFIILLVFFLNNNVFGQITGTKIINSAGGGDYLTINAAITDIQTNGIAGNVTFLIADGVYNEQISFDNLNNSDTIFFKPQNQLGSVNINFLPLSVDSNYVVEFKNSKNIVIQGLTISNQNINTENNGHVIDFKGNTNFITIESCTLIGISTFYDMESHSVIHHNDIDGNNVCSHLKILNNSILNGSKGIFFIGNTNGEFDNMFAGNYISGFYSVGVETHYQNFVTIGKNNIMTSGGSETQSGIIVTGSNYGSAQINSNNINMQATTSNYAISAFDNAETVFAVNNMLSITYGHGENIAMNFDNNLHLRIYNNSTYMTNINQAINLKIGPDNSSDVYILNNIFQNNAGHNKAKAGTAPAYYLHLSVPAFMINHNIYFSLEPFRITQGFDGTNDYTDFISWQSNTGYDNFSKFVDPMFNLVGYDLHIIGSSWAESHGIVTIPPTTNDFDGEPRFGQPGYEGSGTVPDIGADEGNFEGYVEGISGEILNGTVWDKDIYVTGNIHLGYGSTLLINPGIIISFLEGVSFTVDGRVLAIGNPSQKILFTNNNSGGWGGINHNFTSTEPISIYKYCEFEYANNMDGGGGVFRIMSDSISIENCNFYSNSAISGGAISISYSSPKIMNCLFSSNMANSSGGAIYVYSNTNLKLINNVFEYNNAYNGGGAIAFESAANVEMWNNTIINNNTTDARGRELYFYNTTATIYNSIIWNSYYHESAIYLEDYMSNLSFHNCNLPDSLVSPNIINPNGGMVLPYSCIYKDPIFNGSNGFQYQLYPSSPCINAGYSPSPFPFEMTDFAGLPRLSCNTLDIGAFEYNGCPLIADAGMDQTFCGNSTQLNANDPTPNKGYWSTVSGNGKFLNISSPTTYVTDLAPGYNTFIWTVTDQFNSVSDDVTIFNMQAYVYAGEDLHFFSTVYGSLFSPQNIIANEPTAGIGYWEQISGSSIISSSFLQEITVDVQYGVSAFKWTINDEGCINSDTIIVTAGYSFVSNVTDGTLDWGSPGDWDVNGVPGASDSVTIYNCIATISGPNAMCNRLVIGNNSSLTLQGSAKGNAMLTANNLTIEENVIKFKGIKGTATIDIADYSTLNISDPSLTGAITNPTLNIGLGGTIFVHSSATKDGKAIGEGNVNIGSGGKLFIHQTAEKGSKATGEALMEIGSGGKLFISQTAEKFGKVISGGNVNIGSGGKLFIHQTAEKGAAGGKVEIGSGGKLFISQTAEKGVAGGTVVIGSGGKLFIHQTAEKGTGISGGSINIGSGGKLFISQTAEKTVDSAIVEMPVINLFGGTMFVGNQFGGNNVSVLRCENLNISGNTFKSTVIDTNMFVYSNGLIQIYQKLNSSTLSQINITEGANLTLEENGIIDLSEVGNDYRAFFIESGSSFVDRNILSDLNANTVFTMQPGQTNLFTSWFSNTPTDILANDLNLKEFNESLHGWANVASGQIFSPLKGYLIEGISTITSRIIKGKINNGNITYSLEANSSNADYLGWNFMGNPYPSAIVWDSLSFNENVSPVCYVYNNAKNNFEIYQKGGLSLNDASGKILAGQTFFINTSANTNFEMLNSARVHYFNNEPAAITNYQNIIKLNVSDGIYSDQTLIRFTGLATNELDYKYDALKFRILEINSPQIFTVFGTDNKSFAINSVALNQTETIIPLSFKSDATATFTLSIAESSIAENVTVYLRDIEVNPNLWIDFKSNPSYTFDNYSGIPTERFELKFTGQMVNIEDFVAEKEVKAYSNLKTIFIDNPKTSELSIQVIDINGKTLIMKSIYNSGVSEIQTNLPSGIYFVKAVSENKSSVHKIIIH